MKQKGPIEKEDPNAMRKKLLPKGVEQIEKRACEESMKGNNGYYCIGLRSHCSGVNKVFVPLQVRKYRGKEN